MLVRFEEHEVVSRRKVEVHEETLSVSAQDSIYPEAP